MTRFTEDTVELAALDWLSQVGYRHMHGAVIAPGEPAAERASYGEVLRVGRLRVWVSE
jgi:type I restriction enzyme R subunit